jgi:hypothetical protein
MTPLINGSSLAKLDFLSNSEQSDNTKSMANLLNDKIEKDEVDEMAIHGLEKELKDKRNQLDQAKFKYEQRQLYELTE